MTINYIALFGATLAAFAFGGLWYGPLFSKPWLAALGKTEAQLKAGARPMPLLFAITLAASFVMAWVLAGLMLHLAQRPDHRLLLLARLRCNDSDHQPWLSGPQMEPDPDRWWPLARRAADRGRYHWRVRDQVRRAALRCLRTMSNLKTGRDIKPGICAQRLKPPSKTQ
jgi:Protein of unknown function (DUF1761)